MDTSDGFFFTFDAPSRQVNEEGGRSDLACSGASPSTWPPASTSTAHFPWVIADEEHLSQWAAHYCNAGSSPASSTKPRQLTLPLTKAAVFATSSTTSATCDIASFTLCYQTAPEVNTLTSVSTDSTSAATTTTSTEHRDVIPGRYYGGLKVWSCATLLAQYLCENAEHYHPLFRDASVVAELGCGQSLPGLAAISLGARCVAFQDYNEEVLEVCTKPNLGATLAANRAALCATANVPALRVKFVHGDWVDLKWENGQDDTAPSSDGTRDDFCDVILGADVTFDKEACDKLACVLHRWLRPCTGEAIIASKDYYFGTNGGYLEFTRSAQLHGLDVTLLKRVDTADKMPHVVFRVTPRSA